jgi:hypothetical protein
MYRWSMATGAVLRRTMWRKRLTKKQGQSGPLTGLLWSDLMVKQFATCVRSQIQSPI